MIHLQPHSSRRPNSGPLMGGTWEKSLSIDPWSSWRILFSGFKDNTFTVVNNFIWDADWLFGVVPVVGSGVTRTILIFSVNPGCGSNHQEERRFQEPTGKLDETKMTILPKVFSWLFKKPFQIVDVIVLLENPNCFRYAASEIKYHTNAFCRSATEWRISYSALRTLFLFLNLCRFLDIWAVSPFFQALAEGMKLYNCSFFAVKQDNFMFLGECFSQDIGSNYYACSAA